jgi:predicted transporter
MIHESFGATAVPVILFDRKHMIVSFEVFALENFVCVHIHATVFNIFFPRGPKHLKRKFPDWLGKFPNLSGIFLLFKKNSTH